MASCVECGRDLGADPTEGDRGRIMRPEGAALVCSSHIEADRLLMRRRSSSLRQLAVKYGNIAVVEVGPLVEAER